MGHPVFTTVISIVWISTWKLVWTENWIEIAKRFNWHSTVYTQLVVSNSHSKLELLWLLKEHARWSNEGPGDICNNVGHHLLLCAYSVPWGEANILLIRFRVSEAAVLVREMHHQVNIPVWSHKYGYTYNITNKLLQGGLKAVHRYGAVNKIHAHSITVINVQPLNHLHIYESCFPWIHQQFNVSGCFYS